MKQNDISERNAEERAKLNQLSQRMNSMLTE